MSSPPTQGSSPEQWAIYVRVSTRHQAEKGFSLQDQRERLTVFAEEKGWTYQIFEDAGESGEQLDQRPGLVAMLDMADTNRVAGVLVVDESRLARDELVAALIRDRLKRSDTKLATMRGELDLTDPSENFIANVLSAAHAFEQDLRTEKMKSGLRNTAEAGYWPGGPAPYGYQLVPAGDGSAHKQLAINDAEASVLRTVMDLMVNKGHTTYSAATYLNDHGIPTRRGRLWRHPNLCHQLRYKHLTGAWTYNQGEESIEVQIPAIFTKAEWDQIQSSIRGRPRPQRKNRLYPLSGRGRNHLYCQCGANFHGMVRREKKGRPYYTCSNAHHSFGEQRCPHLPRTHQAIPLEEAVWEEVHNVLTDPEYLIGLARAYLDDQKVQPATTAAERRQLQVRYDQLETQETRIVRDLADQNKLDLVDRTLNEIADEKQTLQSRLDEIDDQQTVTNISDDQLRTLSEQARTRLHDSTPELMAEVFDLLDIQLHRVGDDRFEGTGTIPIPDSDGENGDLLPVGTRGGVSKEGPRGPGPLPR